MSGILEMRLEVIELNKKIIMLELRHNLILTFDDNNWKDGKFTADDQMYRKDEYTSVGFLFNGKFYNDTDQLAGQTMNDNNKPVEVFKKKVI